MSFLVLVIVAIFSSVVPVESRDSTARLKILNGLRISWASIRPISIFSIEFSNSSLWSCDRAAKVFL